MKKMRNVVAESSDSETDEETKIKRKLGIIAIARRKKQEKKDPTEFAPIVERYMAIFETAFKDDIALNKESKPSIQKLKKLPLLIQTLSKKHLQKLFIGRGVFALLKNWLQPLTDGRLPNFEIRQAILLLLTDQFRVDVRQYFVREQLKRSGLGKVIMFLSKSNEETLSNQKLAKNLVNKWSREIFNISMRFEAPRSTYDTEKSKRSCIHK